VTPAIKLLQKARVAHNIHEYKHDPGNTAFGLEAAEKLALDPLQVFKTLVVKLDDGSLAVAILPVSNMLSMKAMAKALCAKKAEMANKAEVERATGYVLGGVSPLGQKKRLRTVIDSSAVSLKAIFVSAGKRGLEIELNPIHLQTLTQALMAPLQQ
jgi:Cys-tRNA(Pro)/Cys-tRNA(Cys) deacylase